MRKLRDIDSELKALRERERDLKTRKTVQFGELVEATGADTLPLEALAGVLLAAVEQAKDKSEAVGRWAERGQAFFRDRGAARTSRAKRASGGKTGQDSGHTANGIDPAAGDPNLDRHLRKTAALFSRLLARKARTDMRDWAKARRERTRHLIELGGLVQKAGLVDLTDDDRATMLGAFLEIADQLRLGREGDDRSPQQLAAVWRRRGLRAFDADKAADAAQEVTGRTGRKKELPEKSADR